MGYVDLHTHSTYSDGALSVSELIRKARETGITTLAITDHNKIVPDLEKLQAENTDMKLISGSEISASHVFSTGKKCEIHIIGIMLEKTAKLVEFLNNNNSDGKERAILILEKLRNVGIDIGTYDDIQKMFPGRRIGRMQLAEAIVNHGAAKSVTEAMDELIGDYGKRAAWVESPIDFATIREVVEAIRDSHGLAILAHPVSYRLTEEEFDELMTIFVDAGGHAMEVFYGRYGEYIRKQLEVIAEKWSLIPSCGSDYHAVFDNEKLDYCFPEKIYQELERKYCKEYRKQMTELTDNLQMLLE